MKLKAGNSDNRIHSIDIAKAVCIVFVIVWHYVSQFPENPWFLYRFWLCMAVPVFMIISGYVNTKSYLKKNITQIEKAYSLENIIGRIIRFIIPFIIILVIEEAKFLIWGPRHGIQEMVKHFFVGGYGPGSYYVPLMIQFIFVFPIIYAIIRKYEFKGLIMCGFINFLYEILKKSYDMNLECYRLLIFRYILIIAYGSYLAMSCYKRHIVLSFISFLIGVVYIVICVYYAVIPPITEYWTGTSMWACLYLIPIISPFIINKLKISFLEVVGKASFDICLVQMACFELGGMNLIYKVSDNPIVQLTVLVVSCVLVGVLFYYIETPLTNYINKSTYKIIEKYKNN